jgi:hypothetical protein
MNFHFTITTPCEQQTFLKMWDQMKKLGTFTYLSHWFPWLLGLSKEELFRIGGTSNMAL